MFTFSAYQYLWLFFCVSVKIRHVFREMPGQVIHFWERSGSGCRSKNCLKGFFLYCMIGHLIFTQVEKPDCCCCGRMSCFHGSRTWGTSSFIYSSVIFESSSVLKYPPHGHISVVRQRGRSYPPKPAAAGSASNLQLNICSFTAVLCDIFILIIIYCVMHLVLRIKWTVSL